MKKLYSFLVLFTLLFCSTGNVWGDELTVADRTNSNSYVPIYGNWADAYERCQVLYPSTYLTAMVGKNITGLKFYLNSKPGKAWSGSDYHILLSEVTATSCSSNWNTETTGTEVYSAASLDASSGTLTITFSTPYTYSGGNLLFEMQDKGTGVYANASFYGDSNLGKLSASGYNSTSYASVSATARDFLPKTTFTYEDAAPVSCPKPTDLTKGTVTATSATFSWTSGGSESSWQYVCLPAATEVDWSSASVKTADSETATVTNLSPNTDYKFYVRAYCAENDQSVDVSAAFKTRCVAENISSGWTESFAGLTTGSGKIPDCWGSVTYTYESTIYPYIIGSNASDGDNRSLAFYGGTSTATLYAILPPFEQDIKNLSISFDYINGSKSSWFPQQFSVGYVTDPDDMTTYTNVKTFDQSTSYVSTDDVDFPTTVPVTATNIVIRYAGNQTYSTTGYIDNIHVGLKSSCGRPKDIEVSSTTSDGATLSWTASGKGETTYQWAVAEGSADPVWVDDAAHKVSGTSKALTDLESNTNYTFYVRSYCGAEEQSGAISTTFKTRCGTISESLWEYGFEDDGTYDVPTCWKTYAGTYYFAYVLGSNVHSGNRAMSIAAGKTDANRTYVILPKFDLALSNLSITFYYRGTANATIEVGYVTDVDDKTTFVKVGDALTAATAYKQGFTSFASVAATGQIAFRFQGATGDGDFNIDDIRVARTVTLADNVDNSSLISSLAAEGETVDVLLKRKIWMDGYYNTICLPFSLSADQLADEDCPLNNFKLKVFDYTRTENDEVHMFIAGASSIEAGVPYFASYQGTPTTDKTEHLFRDVQVTAAAAGEKNSEIVTYKGFYAPKVLANQTSNDPYPVIFYLSRNNTIYWPNQDVNLGGFRAYFDVDYSAGAPGRPIRRIIFADQQEDTATGADKVESGKLKVESRKFIENGQLYIIRDGEKYTVLGQKIQ